MRSDTWTWKGYGIGKATEVQVVTGYVYRSDLELALSRCWRSTYERR